MELLLGGTAQATILLSQSHLSAEDIAKLSMFLKTPTIKHQLNSTFETLDRQLVAS